MSNVGSPGSADLPIGAPRQESGNPTWHSRGYLPHFESTEVIQHVTIHLADSLPGEVVDEMNAELKSLPENQRDLARRKKIEAWIDAGHGSCLLRDPVIAAMVQSCLLFFDAKRYRLLAWVVMPNHVHALVLPREGWTIARIVASWKKFTARQIGDLRRLGNPGAAKLLPGSESHANQEIGDPRQRQPVWHREYWDRYMRDENHFFQAVRYIHENLVKAGLASKAEDWPWSSAFPGNADLLIGEGRDAGGEIGSPHTERE